jgi:nucleolar protein 56
MDKYLAKVVPEEMPNTSALLGHLLAARLLAQAGGLERLAKMPSSTIQLLGAEKALFRALKEMRNQRGRAPSGDAKVPRFGIIFTHPDISGAPNEQRGKIARLLSAKVTIAARMDFYSKENHGAELLADYKKKLAEVK